jgi:hypothetical protein
MGFEKPCLARSGNLMIFGCAANGAPYKTKKLSCQAQVSDFFPKFDILDQIVKYSDKSAFMAWFLSGFLT